MKKTTVLGNGEGNKVTKTTLQEPGICIMLADSGKIIFQSPEARSVSGGGLCNQGVFARDGSQVVRKTSQLRRNKMVQSFPSTHPLQTVVTVRGDLVGPSWRSVTLLSLQKASCSPRVGKPRPIPDT
jgi:hypothetical protein